MKANLNKTLPKSFIDKFQKNLPTFKHNNKSLDFIKLSKSAEEDPLSTDGFKFNEINRLKLNQFNEVLKQDNSKAGFDFQKTLQEMKSLSYVNEIKQKEPPIEYYNRAELLNKRMASPTPIEPTKDSKRCGLLGYKVGMISVWDKFGTIQPLTVIKIDNCQVTQVRTEDKDKKWALQLGVGSRKPKHMTKAEIGHLILNDIPPKQYLKEFRVTQENILPIGYLLSVRHYSPGQYVDVVATSKGHGFQGVMKRWNFGGGFATHGNSLKHRSIVKFFKLGFNW
jgi:50S ribosomal protein uL3